MLYRYPELVREDETVIASLLKPGMTYVDVGANIGTTTLAGAIAVGLSGQVYAFEAHPQTAQGLQKSIEVNPTFKNTITVKHVALGAEVGVTHVSDLDMDDLNFVTDEGIEVPISTLDKELAEVGHINLIKIDVEGYEKFVFEGAVKTFEKTDMIYFESSEPNFGRFGYTLDVILEQLNQAHFTVFSIKGDQKIEVKKGYRNYGEYENLLAVKS